MTTSHNMRTLKERVPVKMPNHPGELKSLEELRNNRGGIVISDGVASNPNETGPSSRGRTSISEQYSKIKKRRKLVAEMRKSTYIPELGLFPELEVQGTNNIDIGTWMRKVAKLRKYNLKDISKNTYIPEMDDKIAIPSLTINHYYNKIK
jgi:hypothetical protein